MNIPELDPLNLTFPHPSLALVKPDGLIAYGGNLSESTLLKSYSEGIFPWYNRTDPILWWCPSERAIIMPKQFKLQKSLKKYQRKHQYKITINYSFENVISLCFQTRKKEETWLNPEMISAYINLHYLGYCHSVEVWSNNDLVGGFYGVSLGSVFCGESMFSIAPNASKIALWFFCNHFYKHGGGLIDCQVPSKHLLSMGAEIIKRDIFLEQLKNYSKLKISTSCFSKKEIFNI